MFDKRGMYNKYQIINRETGKEVKGDYFVLKPGKDAAARAALLTYAGVIIEKNVELGRDCIKMFMRCTGEDDGDEEK